MRVVRYSVRLMSYPSASSMMRFFVWAGIFIVSVVVLVVGFLGGLPGLRFVIGLSGFVVLGLVSPVCYVLLVGFGEELSVSW